MITIGRKDKVDLPDFGLMDIDAKIDTGAYGCALHCHHIEVVSRGGKDVLSFKVLDPSHPESKDLTFHAERFNDKVVKNSGGGAEHRYTIVASMIIFGKKYKVEFSLTDRSSMKSPILIGRKFLKKRFLVDVAQKDLSFTQKQES